jgi:hypothetical protein
MNPQFRQVRNIILSSLSFLFKKTVKRNGFESPELFPSRTIPPDSLKRLKKLVWNPAF